MDLVFSLPEGFPKDLEQRMKSRHAFRQLSYMQEMGMGNRKYRLLDLDNGEQEISTAEAVKNVKPWTGV